MTRKAERENDKMAEQLDQQRSNNIGDLLLLVTDMQDSI